MFNKICWERMEVLIWRGSKSKVGVGNIGDRKTFEKRSGKLGYGIIETEVNNEGEAPNTTNAFAEDILPSTEWPGVT